MTAATVVFLALSIVTLVGALGTVLLRNIVHSALFLVMSFVSVAGIYILLEADFLFAVQILIYVGAVATLILFGIMLTRACAVSSHRTTTRLFLPAIIAALLFFASAGACHPQHGLAVEQCAGATDNCDPAGSGADEHLRPAL